MILHQFIDYDTLRIIWWLLLGILLIGFAVMDGFDLGAAALLPFVAKTDVERRVVIDSIGPTWEGNQVWLILAAGRSSPRGHLSMRSRSQASISRCSPSCSH